MTAQQSAEEIYSQVVKELSPSEQFRLATMILNGIPPRSVVDYDDKWSEEDIAELTAHCLRYAGASFGEEEEGSAESG